ncbi:MAG: PKD domain-containing protein [Thermoplasmata archaeon]|nr:PKD domain-containing protein [Thermoplasmata archaeon]
MNTNRRTANKPKIEITARARVLNKRSILMVLYAIYIAFILVSIVPYIAEHQTRHKMDGEDFVYHIVFEEDGDDVAHYFEVVRADNSTPGILDLTYYPSTHVLDVDVINIQELVIDSESIYKDEAEVIVGANYADDPDYYKDWFIDQEVFTVKVISDTIMTRLEFNDIPIPVSVLVDNEEWWKTNTNWKQLDDDDFEITKVPEGSTTVVIYFKGDKPMIPPNAEFTISDHVVPIDKDVVFDASESTDDGTIDYYIWDFGDSSEPESTTIDNIIHSYSTPDNYTVSLTVIDDDNLDDTASKSIIVVISDEDNDQDGVYNQFDPHPFDYSDTDGDELSDDFEDFYDGNAYTSEPWPDGDDLNKYNKDTDSDGYDDNIELAKFTDPLDPADYPTEPEPDEDEGLTGMGTTGDIIVILIIVIIVVLIIVMLIIRKRKEGGAVEAAEVDEEPPLDEGVKVGPGLVKRGQREMGPGPAISPLKPGKDLAKPAKPKRSTKKPPVSRALKKPVMPTHPPIKKLSTKPPIQPRVMLDILEEDSLRKFLPPQPVPKIPVKSPSLDSLKPPSPKPPAPSPSELSAKPKPIAPKPSMGSLVKTKPPTSLKPDALSDQSPAEFKTETTTKFAQALGIGKAKASALYNGGFTSIAQLQKATKEELMNVKGIGPKMADRIIKNLEFLMAKRI